MSTTYRRDKLRRLAEKGRLMMTDGAAGELPVRVMQGNDWKDGWCNVWASDFDGNCGRAYQAEDGSITLYVHTNRNFKFRVLPEGETAKPLPPPPPPEPAPPLPPPPPTRITAPFVAEVGQRLVASFARLNKRCTLAEYREECRRPADFYEERCEVEAVRTLTPEEWDHFADNLMDDVDWLGTGGTNTDADLPEGWDFHTGTEAERDAFRRQAYSLVTVIQAPGRETFVVDAQGYTYARYVGLDPALVQK